MTAKLEVDTPKSGPAIFRAKVGRQRKFEQIDEVFYRSSSFTGQLGSVLLMLMTQCDVDSIVVTWKKEPKP